MESLREISESIIEYCDLAEKVTDVSEYDELVDRIEYLKGIKNEIARRMIQMRAWESYLSAIEKKKMLELGGDPDIYALTTEEKVAVSICDKGQSRMLR